MFFYTENFLHTDAWFAQSTSFYKENLLRTEIFARRSFYTKKPIHRAKMPACCKRFSNSCSSLTANGTRQRTRQRDRQRDPPTGPANGTRQPDKGTRDNGTKGPANGTTGHGTTGHGTTGRPVPNPSCWGFIAMVLLLTLQTAMKYHQKSCSTDPLWNIILRISWLFCLNSQISSCHILVTLSKYHEIAFHEKPSTIMSK